MSLSGRPRWLAAASALPPMGVPVRTPMHPGRLLARTCLAPLGLSQSEAARVLGLSRRRLHELVHGQRAMSPDTAIRCARQFGIDAGFWLAHQAAWDSFHAWKRLCAPTPSSSH
ncbi:MAG: HigA family addiction module antidote protein [Hydrogenophaga sp.]|uniref:HigA family addiction module antitoxin n=1 Tax=Hydrogenophaga sp. TaxID=1904254 RepID=UPI0025B8DC64|nr:HigA family addiction module antitoxin [Hydrogenophaga sp.]MBT9552332.1 HigA family addiction module antidote protein [Hydrogenophaga sp.]